MKILILDDQPTWAEAYCKWMGGRPPESRPRYKAVSLPQLKQWLSQTR